MIYLAVLNSIDKARCRVEELKIIKIIAHYLSDHSRISYYVSLVPLKRNCIIQF